MKPLFTLLSANVLLPPFASAPSNYQLGCVVTLNGDTRKRFIDYRELPAPPRNISFKETGNATETWVGLSKKIQIPFVASPLQL
jgi:hypothetical protein